MNSNKNQKLSQPAHLFQLPAYHQQLEVPIVSNQTNRSSLSKALQPNRNQNDQKQQTLLKQNKIVNGALEKQYHKDQLQQQQQGISSTSPPSKYHSMVGSSNLNQKLKQQALSPNHSLALNSAINNFHMANSNTTKYQLENQKVKSESVVVNSNSISPQGQKQSTSANLAFIFQASAIDNSANNTSRSALQQRSDVFQTPQSKIIELGNIKGSYSSNNLKSSKDGSMNIDSMNSQNNNESTASQYHNINTFLTKSNSSIKSNSIYSNQCQKPQSQQQQQTRSSTRHQNSNQPFPTQEKSSCSSSPIGKQIGSTTLKNNYLVNFKSSQVACPMNATNNSTNKNSDKIMNSKSKMIDFGQNYSTSKCNQNSNPLGLYQSTSSGINISNSLSMNCNNNSINSYHNINQSNNINNSELNIHKQNSNNVYNSLNNQMNYENIISATKQYLTQQPSLINSTSYKNTNCSTSTTNEKNIKQPSNGTQQTKNVKLLDLKENNMLQQFNHAKDQDQYSNQVEYNNTPKMNSTVDNQINRQIQSIEQSIILQSQVSEYSQFELHGSKLENSKKMPNNNESQIKQNIQENIKQDNFLTVNQNTSTMEVVKKDKLAGFSSRLSTSKEQFQELHKQIEKKRDWKIEFYHSNIEKIEQIEIQLKKVIEDSVKKSKQQLLDCLNETLAICRDSSFSVGQILNYLNSTENDLVSNLPSIVNDMDISSLEDIISQYDTIIKQYNEQKEKVIMQQKLQYYTLNSSQRQVDQCKCQLEEQLHTILKLTPLQTIISSQEHISALNILIPNLSSFIPTQNNEINNNTETSQANKKSIFVSFETKDSNNPQMPTQLSPSFQAAPSSHFATFKDILTNGEDKYRFSLASQSNCNQQTIVDSPAFIYKEENTQPSYHPLTNAFMTENLSQQQQQQQQQQQHTKQLFINQDQKQNAKFPSASCSFKNDFEAASNSNNSTRQDYFLSGNNSSSVAETKAKQKYNDLIQKIQVRQSQTDKLCTDVLSAAATFPISFTEELLPSQTYSSSLPNNNM